MHTLFITLLNPSWKKEAASFNTSIFRGSAYKHHLSSTSEGHTFPTDMLFHLSSSVFGNCFNTVNKPGCRTGQRTGVEWMPLTVLLSQGLCVKSLCWGRSVFLKSLSATISWGHEPCVMLSKLLKVTLAGS